MSKLNKLPVKQEVIHKLAIGETQTSIAGQVGVDQSTVSRFANEEEAIKAIEVEKLKLAEVVPYAVQNVKTLVEEMKDIPKDDIKSRELSYKASKDVLEAVNVYSLNMLIIFITITDNKMQSCHLHFKRI